MDLAAHRMLPKVKGFIIRFFIHPQSPENFQPAIRQTSDRIAVRSAAGTDGAVERGCPGRGMEGQPSPLLYDMAKLMVTGGTEIDVEVFAATICHRTGACHRLQNSRGWKTSSIISEFRQQGWCQKRACLRETVVHL